VNEQEQAVIAPVVKKQLGAALPVGVIAAIKIEAIKDKKTLSDWITELAETELQRRGVPFSK
jgi:hypothetical protein